MFRRRRSRSASHHQPLSSSATLSAQTAASHAFLNSQPSSSSLSSAAAAAAALRSLTPTPTPVESVQTKRMVQRRTSVTSQNSGLPNLLRPSSRDGLRRARSSSSMSSRTFRDPSPRGPNAGRNSGTPPLPPPPPIPSIPPVYGPQSSSRPLPRRSASVGPSPSRSVSSGKRPASSGGRGASVEPDGRLSTVPELQRAGSRNSINFSYPMNSRPNSPSWDSDRRDASTGVSLAGQLAASEIPQRQNSVSSQTANTSARRTTRVPSEQGSPGRAVLPVGTAVAAAQAAVVPRTEESAASSPSSSPRAAGRREMPVREMAPPEPKPSPRAVATKPEAPEVLENTRKEEPAQGSRSSAVALPAPAPVPAAVPVGAPVGAPEGAPAGRVTPDRAKVMTPPTPERAKSTPSSSVLSSPESTKSDGLSPEIHSPRRQPSNSPGRSARFSSRLAITGFGEHLHQPPPRSVSPAKSAMKNSRKSSLSPDGRTNSVLRPGPPLSELSDATSVASDDGNKPAARRKQVKVSFDDEAEVVGVAASPPTSPEEIAPSPPSLGKARTKGSWFGVVKRKPMSNDLGEVLTPRPALPSFGSIRGGRNGRPSDMVQDELSDSESFDSSESSPISSFSHDHALAGILTNAPSRDTQKASSMDHAPSPAAASTMQQSVPADAPNRGVHADADFSNVRPVTELSSKTHQAAPARNSLLAAPDITVQPATPELEQGRSSLDWYTVPGGFPRSSLEYDPSKRSGIKPYQAATADDQTHLDDAMETDDESGESIYSDAEEGFAEDNFGSINAIVDEQPAAGPPRAAVQGQGHRIDTQRTNEEPPALPELPETCQIAKADPPAREVTVAEILESNQQPFPFAATDPPPLGSRPTVRNNSTKRIPRSERVADLAQRSASVDDYDRSAPVNATSPDVNGPAQPEPEPEVTSGASFFRQRLGKEQAKKRSLSWGPSRLKGAKSTNTGDEPSVNEKTAFPLQRPSSHGSDSSSSFKRFYRPRADSQHSMLRTLRAAPPSAPAQSSKPTSSTPRPRSSGLGSGSMPATLRTGESRREKPSFFSTGKIQKSRSSNAAFTSRFADSDDEVGNATTPRWKSRYADSSDEERGVGTLRPVRGIPRRQGTHDGDSTELEDSSDNDNHRPHGRRRRQSQSTPAAPAAGKRQLHKSNAPVNGSSAPRNPAFAAVAKSRGMTEDELEEFMHQPGTGRRSNSILRRFSMRKFKSPAPPGRSLAHAPGSVIHEVDTPHDGTPSNGITTTITANNGATPSSKLKKRGGDAADNWPLQPQTNGETPASAPGNAPTAPTTNGVGRNGSATVESVTSEADHAASSTVGESEKLTGEGRHLSSNRESGVMDVGFGAPRKKRFPRLRKAFGLH